jgi:protoporphyrinogen/coproporphyrinogen III oxidase
MGSVLRGFAVDLLREKQEEPLVEREGESYDMGDVEERLMGASVFSFRDGIEEITRALEGALKAKQGVEMIAGTGVKSLRFDRASNAFEVRSFPLLLQPMSIIFNIRRSQQRQILHSLLHM